MDEATAVTPVTVDPTPSGDVAAEHKPYIRLGTLKDLDKMVDVACHAFNRDPVFNYMGNLKEVCKLGLFGSAKSRSSDDLISKSNYLHLVCPRPLSTGVERPCAMDALPAQRLVPAECARHRGG